MNAGLVYVLAFDNGLVKVGQTQNARSRFNSHNQTARNFGLTVTGRWESPLHVGWLANERALKRIAAELGGTPTTPEYFSGVNFDALTEKARELPFTPPEDAPQASQPIAPWVMNSDLGTNDLAVRKAALRVRAERDARRDAAKVYVGSFFLSRGITPAYMRDVLEEPELADFMAEVLSDEAYVRQRIGA